MSRYWRAIYEDGERGSFTDGKIYESDNSGYGMIDNLGSPFNNIKAGEFLQCKFEEVIYQDYILQEFVEERIAIALKDYDACEYWRELLKEACVKKEIKNSFDFALVYDEWDNDDNNFYYVQDNKVRSDGKESAKRVILERLTKTENKKEENKEMNKEFTKSDLINGMVVETRDEVLYLIHNEYLLDRNGENNLYLEDYNEELLDCDERQYDIVRVFKSDADTLNDLFDKIYLDLIWERNDNLKKEYEFRDIIISPNGKDYKDEEEGGQIFIKKFSDDWDDDSFAITIDEAEFLIKSLTEIVTNMKK